jgi:transcription elongation GreA/GreB family factor
MKRPKFIFIIFALMEMNEFKEKIHNHCFDFLYSRLKRLTEEEESLKQDMANDTKSSAGDKYETSRERASQQLDQVLHKMNESKVLLKALYVAHEVTIKDKAAFGCLVQTNRGFFYIAIPLGKVVIDGQNIFCISQNSPIGQYIADCSTGDKFAVNNVEYEVLGIY